MYNLDMKETWELGLVEFTIVSSVLSSHIPMIITIAISFLLGTAFGSLVTVAIIKSFHKKRSLPDTQEISASRQDTLRIPTNNTAEPTYLNADIYRNQWIEKTPVENAPVYAECGVELVGLPHGL